VTSADIAADVSELGSIAKAMVGLTRVTVRIARFALLIAMILLCVMIFYTLIGRFFLEYAPPMLGELSGYLFVWISFIAAAVVVHQRGHPRLEFVVGLAPEGVGEYLTLAAQFAVLAFFAALVWYGWQIVLSSSNTTAPTSGISMAYLYASLLVGSALATLYTLTEIVTEVRFTTGRFVLAVAVFSVTFLVLSRTIELPSGYVFTVLAVVLVLMMLIGMPVGIALGSASLMGMALTSHIPLLLIPQKMVDGLDSFVLVCVPLYLLVGGLMASGSTASRLLGIANALVGWVRGGIGLADVVASALFADISASAVSDVAAIGAVVGPELVRRGFRPEQAAALQAAAGVQGILFPPSLTMIVYAWVADVSVGQLFLNLFIPGLIVMFSFMLVVYVMARRNGLQACGKPNVPEIAHAFKRGFLVLWTPVIILGGIVSGFATTTEVGVIAVAYALLLEVVIYRDLPLRKVGDVIIDAAIITGRIGIILASATALGWILVANEGPQKVIDALIPIAPNAFVLLILINLFLIAIHTVLEAQTTILVIVPLLVPALEKFHVSMVHFGVILNLNSAMGLILPPIGICLYVVSSLMNVPVGRVARFALPFVAVLAVDLALVIAFPKLSTFFTSYVF
jgi:tripartite ATP-independent transporter DctM subunit